MCKSRGEIEQVFQEAGKVSQILFVVLGEEKAMQVFVKPRASASAKDMGQSARAKLKYLTRSLKYINI